MPRALRSLLAAGVRAADLDLSPPGAHVPENDQHQFTLPYAMKP